MLDHTTSSEEETFGPSFFFPESAVQKSKVHAVGVVGSMKTQGQIPNIVFTSKASNECKLGSKHFVFGFLSL